MAKPTKKTNRTLRAAKAAKPKWEDRFIKAFAAERSVSHACRAAGVSRSTVYSHRKERPEFEARWEEVLGTIRDDLEASALRLAIDGGQDFVFDKSGQKHFKVRHFPNLKMFMLAKLIPERYGDKIEKSRDPSEVAQEIRDEVAAMDRLTVGEEGAKDDVA